MQPVNAATLGLVLGISRSRVVNLAADGVLPRAGRGLFDLPACVQAYLRHKLVMAKAGDVTALSLVAERSRLTKIKADAAEVESRKLAGELVPAADIEAAWLAVAGAVRSRLLVIPSKDGAAHCRAEDAGGSASAAAEGNQCCTRRHRRHAGNLICSVAVRIAPGWRLRATLAAFAPPPTLTVSQWADRERRLSPEASAQNRDSGIPRGRNTFAASWTRSLTRP